MTTGERLKIIGIAWEDGTESVDDFVFILQQLHAERKRSARFIREARQRMKWYRSIVPLKGRK